MLWLRLCRSVDAFLFDDVTLLTTGDVSNTPKTGTYIVD